MKRLTSSLACLALIFSCAKAECGETAAAADARQLFSTCHGFLEGPTFDPAGNLWVVDVVGGKIHSISPDGVCHLRATIGSLPNGARFRKDGKLIIADAQKGILAVDTSTMHIDVLADSYNGQPIRTANDLAIDQSGGIYFTVPNGSTLGSPVGRVYYLPPGGSAGLTLLADKLAFPNGIALSPDGEEVYVGQMVDKSIISIPAVGSHAVMKLSYLVLRTNGGIGPDGIALDSAGRLFWANFSAGSIGWADTTHNAMPSLPLGGVAGKGTSNLAIHDGWIYVTEAFKGEVWRVPLPK